MKDKKNANFAFVLECLKGSECGYLDWVGQSWLKYEDDNVNIVFKFNEADHSLTEAKCIWYANKYQCLKFTDLTKEGCLKYFKMFNLK